MFVQAKKERCRNVVVNLPQRSDHAACAGDEKCPGQARHPCNMLRIAAEGSTCGQYDERMLRQTQPFYIVRAKASCVTPFGRKQECGVRAAGIAVRVAGKMDECTASCSFAERHARG